MPRHFAEINSRDGFFVLGRAPADSFQWGDFAGSTIIPVGFSPMPWASFQYALRNNGVDLAGLTLLTGLGLDDAIEAFRAGRADFIHLPEPAAEQLLAEGVGNLTVALGQVNGHIAYSSFAATNAFLEANPDMVHRFVAGYARALDWLAGADPPQVARGDSIFLPGNRPGTANSRHRPLQGARHLAHRPPPGPSAVRGLAGHFGGRRYGAGTAGLWEGG